ncbi:D-xylose ABC transporter ATP-binding protein [Micromonospora globispora]|uniref:sugar ABC transporter ATP-binding protein n=1 Tax=Micromonospora globispora TaxID=1450148 RepID=UPI000D6EDA48|nr:sugar ABC transporter ATP-binding protein [Micromonospora globispora]PWU55488.1 D-xylose ABC transporter ATP-binding protein [Micromonospora globispora]RQW98016.1 D-xylose ABC transporter ATP-binding protein [Micromonospora globispora]
MSLQVQGAGGGLTADVGSRIDVRGVTKSFGATRALSGVDLEVRAGEVHTVMGENGCGKSTLVKILSAVHRPDTGTISVDGRTVQQMRSPSHARRIGIATVFQEVLTVPGRTIFENIWIGARTTHLDKAERRQRTTNILTRLLGEPVDVDAPIESLPLSGRQACCVARSLVADPAVLILDESTSALDVATRDRLFEIVHEMTGNGASVLFISHRMDEVFEISDVLTVLRAGRTVASRLPASSTSPDELVRHMSGVEANAERRSSRPAGEVVLRASALRLLPDGAPIDFELRAGELVGLAGLEGQGQDAFLKALRGAPALGGGRVRRTGECDGVVLDKPSVARRHGVAYVPRERRHEGMFEQLAIGENFGLPRLAQDTVGGLIQQRRTFRRLRRQSEPLRLKMGDPRDLITTLSGGNQQKVILARALADVPKVLLLNDPTRGIDQNAKNDLYAVFDDLSVQGVAVVMLSSDVNEIVQLVDRVLVFRDQSVSAELTGDEVTRSNIVAAYFGSVSDGARDTLEGTGDAEQNLASGA